MKSQAVHDPSTTDVSAAVRGRSVSRLWLLASLSALLLVTLAVAFGLLLTARKKTMDALVIVTIPSGAVVVFDGSSLGPSPVTLEDVRFGAHTLTAEKDGFVAVEREVTITADTDEQLELTLKPVAPPGSVAHTAAERVDEFSGLAEDAFARGELIHPVDRSALYYADAILSIDRQNAYAAELRRRIRTARLAEGRSAESAHELARAKTAYTDLAEAFPGDTEILQRIAAVDELLRREQNRLQEYITSGRAALRAGRIVEPDGRSAYDFAERAMAIDPEKPAAVALRKEVRDRALDQSSDYAARGQIEQAVELLRKLVTLYPQDRSVRGQFDGLMAGRGGEVIDARREAGLKAYRAGNYRSAVENLRAAVRLGASDAATHTALGQAELRLGNTAEARRELERVARQGDAQVDTLVALAELDERDGALRDALARYRTALKLGGSVNHPPQVLGTAINRLEALVAGQQAP